MKEGYVCTDRIRIMRSGRKGERELAENNREIVLDILLALEREPQHSNRLIRAVLDKYDYLESRDKAFIKRLSEGTIERRIELDYHLNQFSSVPVLKMKPLIRCLLRMSVYQLLYMDNIPDSAICNEACKLAVKKKFTSLKGFVNGVLRTVARNKGNLSYPDAVLEPVLYLSVKYSAPEWIVESWIQEYGRTVTERMLEGLLEIHPVSLRFHSHLKEEQRQEILRLLAETGVVAEKSIYTDLIYTLTHVEHVNLLPGFEEGKWTVQDVSSALAVLAAEIKPGDFVIDVCAAPGGKTILAAELTGATGRVLSRDVSCEKIERIHENMERFKLYQIETQVWDATVTDESLIGKADVVLMDVPCSGLGVLGKKRDIKYHITPQGIDELQKLQKEIAKTCVKYLKPGGTLLYSTCTINRGENEAMVQYLTENLGLQPVSLEGSIPSILFEQRVLIEDMKRKDLKRKDPGAGNHSYIQLLPGFMQADGFFFSKLRKL